MSFIISVLTYFQLQLHLQFQITKTGKSPYFNRKNQVEGNAIEVEFEVEKSIHHLRKNLVPVTLAIGLPLSCNQMRLKEVKN